MSKTKKKRNKKYNPNNRIDAKNLNERELLVRKLMAAKKTIENLKKTAAIYKNVFEGITGEFNCRQFQMIGQDLASILIHIHDLEENGPSKAHKDIPLEDSVIEMSEAEENQLRLISEAHAEDTVSE